MPFTPFHFGPALLTGVLLFPFIDLVAIMVSSVILDIEPFLVLFLRLQAPLHGLSHTYLVATIVAILTAGVLWLLRTPITDIASMFGVTQEPSKQGIFLACLFGTYSHVLMDSFIYAEMNPFFPIVGNPFLGLVAVAVIYQFCLYSGIVGFLLYFIRFYIIGKRPGSDVVDPFQ